MSFRIFISRKPNEVLKLREFCELIGWHLLARPLISFQSVPIEIATDFDVLFFPSPRAVQFFFNENTRLNVSNKLMACAGNQTASEIRKMGYEVHFIPSHPGDVSSVRDEFQKWLGESKVLYVGSNLAKKSVLTNLNENQWTFLQVYETKFEIDIVPESDIYVFTSPSNVQSFFVNNSLKFETNVIAWGTSTAEELEKYNLVVNHTLERSEEKELIELLVVSY